MNNTNLNFIFFFIILFSNNIAFSQEKLDNNFENSLLWKIESKDAKNIMYIMGTHHLYDKSFLDNEKNIQNILPKIDVFVGELYEDSLENINKGVSLMKSMLLENTTMKELLSDKQYKKVDKWLKTEIGIALSMFDNIKPVAVTNYIQVIKYAKKMKKSKVEEESKSLVVDNSMDLYFQQFAKKNNKTIIGLETAEQQMNALFSDINLKRQVENLMDLVEDKNGGSEKAMEKMDELYVSQNINELYHFVEKYSNEQEMNALLYKRNKNWFPMLTKMLQSSKKHFVAVGAGHLIGKWGVLTMLKEEGYKLTPLKLDIIQK